MKLDSILSNVSEYYTCKVVAHGATAKGVDWNSSQSQTNRFDQLLKVCENADRFSINDYGCGYGALLDHTRSRIKFRSYNGFDISEQMVRLAKELHKDIKNSRFVSDESKLKPADFSIASGIFNVKLKTSKKEWLEYVLHTINKIDQLSKKGFSFNMLTKYSDAEYMRKDLFYGDPCFLFDYCKTRFSRQVALLHDYGLYEFTIIVRK